MREHFYYYRREWLNGPGLGTAFIEGKVERPQANASRAWFEGGDLTIKDCTHQVLLSFPISNSEVRENSLRKIATLFEVVEQFQTQLLHAADLAEKSESLRTKSLQKKSRTREDDECDCPNCADGEFVT